MDDAGAELHILLAQYEDEELADDDFMHQHGAVVGLLCLIGAEEARLRRAERRRNHRLYLTRPDLLPNPRQDTPWQRLFDGANDRAFITTMGFDVATFFVILNGGFEEKWDATPIPRNDVPNTAIPRINRRSLDAAGALGLALHYLNSTMHEISLQQIFALIPTTVSRYVNFALEILCDTLRKLPNAVVRDQHK